VAQMMLSDSVFALFPTEYRSRPNLLHVSCLFACILLLSAQEEDVFAIHDEMLLLQTSLDVKTDRRDEANASGLRSVGNSSHVASKFDHGVASPHLRPLAEGANATPGNFPSRLLLFSSSQVGRQNALPGVIWIVLAACLGVAICAIFVYIIYGDEARGYGFGVGGWKFDNKVAANFLNEMRQHIPGWAEVVELCPHLVKKFYGTDARILSFWVGYGVQFDAYLKQGWSPQKLFGINYSQPLFDIMLNRLPDVTCRFIPESTRPYDPREDGPFDVVQMLWSLHFEYPKHPEKRKEVMRNVFASLSAGGVLLLAEKTTQSPETEEQYYDFKRSQGVSEETIQEKKASLVGVLETLPKEWYSATLQEVGFVDITIAHEYLGFVTWWARKPK